METAPESADLRPVPSIDARTGETIEVVATESTVDEVAAATTRAAEAASWLEELGREGRARLLNELAGALEDDATQIIATADRETALGEARLTAELARTAYQLRFMGEVALEGSYLDASIEGPAATPMGPRPDLRRSSVPLGPVGVFGASNFPLAFSAPGGDTASALAAGCPVVVKAHSAHAGTSVLVHRAFADVLNRWQAPAGVFQLVFGRAAGTALVADPRIQAVGFTGSVSGGRALFTAAALRPDPIPFFGELGSVNPLVVTSAAARVKAEEVGAGIAASMTMGNGQFCTKPGLFLIGDGPEGDTVVSALVAALEASAPGHLLTDGIRESFTAGTDALTALADVSVLYRGRADERRVAPVLVSVDAQALTGDHYGAIVDEYFGPFGVVIRFGSLRELQDVLVAFPPALTGTVHTSGHDDPDVPEITRLLARRSGRVIVDQYPTGVSVAWGMHHGGPYPATTSAATSVGANSIKRWVRPITYQNAPDSVLPHELRDDPPAGLPRRVDGVLQLS
ncbi:MAG: aldehyde dehydrogenase (NADP(+)) [Microcella sp.]|uniref:aldehyde dehydrogenase (NADP(+)) n=1 Tax=Microcella sp. TaxID=1913979 RepID=UPI0033146155